MMQQSDYTPEYKEHRRQLMAYANSGIVPNGIDPRKVYKNHTYNDNGGKQQMTNNNQHREAHNEKTQLPDTVSDLFPSKWLNASDLNGRTFDLVIARLEGGMFPIHPRTREKELKAIVYFKKAQKGLILNSTQAQQIAEIAGSERFSDWPGTAVTLASGTAPNGKQTIAIRNAPPPAKTPAPVTAQPQPTNGQVGDKDKDIFDLVYKNGDPVRVGHRAMFHNYRRAHEEEVPEDFRELQRWVVQIAQ